ncbi:hypothetical protein NDU88_000213 [Pleurodeles waltl]|uniref:Uncharacterized protein n=1 Tax=Pleurodeles waltl TaxID=8319 RepID=A0AAV7UPC4_PLEWA|nr:hypothetical protein NDU88_000213 [Pleurodeles waltl]
MSQGWSRPCEAALYIGDERVPESPRRPQRTYGALWRRAEALCPAAQSASKDKEASGARRSNSGGAPRLCAFSVPHMVEVQCCRPEARTASASCKRS